MTDNLLPEPVEPYYNLSSKAYEHPADRAATAALKAIPMLDSLVRRLLEWRYERATRQYFLGTTCGPPIPRPVASSTSPRCRTSTSAPRCPGWP